MKFEDVIDFPEEREAYMFVRSILGLSEEEYLKLSYIERRELALAYRIAKKLGLEEQEKLYEGYKNTSMFNGDSYDLAEATMIIKEKAGILSLARTKLDAKESIEEFVLKGDLETKAVLEKVKEAYAEDYDNVIEHLRPLVEPTDSSINDGFNKETNNKFQFN